MTSVEIILADLTSMQLDAIVCPAHKHLIRGQGVSAHIFDLAGDGLAEECASAEECQIGEARLTGAYNLPAKHLIHTVTPQWSGGDQWVSGTLKQLSQCYESVIQVALANNIRSLAIPALGAGSNKVPHPIAAHQALEVLHKYADQFDRLVVCLRSDETMEAWQATHRKFFPE